MPLAKSWSHQAGGRQAAVESIKRMLSKLHFSVGQPPTVLRLLKDQVICEDRLFVT